jgi:hypothetical protein
MMDETEWARMRAEWDEEYDRTRRPPGDWDAALWVHVHVMIPADPRRDDGED